MQSFKGAYSLFIFCCVSMHAQQFGLTTQTAPTRDFEQIAPYWTTEPGWHTDLQLRNALATSSLTVNAAVRTADGNEIALKPFMLLSNEAKTISIMDALMEVHSGLAGQAEAYGSIVLRYNSKSMRNLFASVMVHVTGQPIMYHLDASAAATGWKAGNREGIWWLPTATVQDFLALTNQANHSVEGSVELTDGSGKMLSQAFDLQPGGSQRLSVGALVRRAGWSAKFGGIRVVMSQDAGMLDTTHILWDVKSGFSATMKMFDHNPAQARGAMDFAGTGKWVTRAPMLALSQPDPLLALPGKTILQPMFLVRNTTNRSIDVVADLHWRNASQDGLFTIPAFTLAPQEVRVVDVAQLQQSGNVPLSAYWAQVTLTADAEPDDLVAVAASYDATLRYGAQTPFSDQLASHLEGGEWRVDSTHTSILAVGNGGGSPTDAVLAIMFDQGRSRYVIERTIGPRDQWFVDLGAIIRSGVPDSAGTVLPVDLASGTYSLRESGPSPQGFLYEGKVITDKTFGHATYGCMQCCGFNNGVSLNPDPIFGFYGGTSSVGALGGDACDGGSTDITSHINTLTSADSSIMSVASHVLVNNVGVGSTTITARLINVPDGTGEEGHGTCPNAAPFYTPGDGEVSPAITITYTGGDGTTINGTTQNAVTGQQIALTANYTLPSGVSVTSQSWSVPGTTIGGYTASITSASVQTTNFSTDSTIYYWLDSGSSRIVTFTLTISDGSSSTATVSFNVVAPSVTVTTSRDTAIIGYDSSANPAIRFGHFPTIPGITFSSTVTPPSGYSGTIKWVQLITSLGATYTYPSPPSPLTCTFVLGLDGQYPYATTTSTNDSPASPFRENATPADPTGATLNLGASMYLLWTPTVSNAVQVPLGHVDWGLSATVTSYVASSNTGMITSTSFSSFVVDTSYPTWTSITNGVPSCY